MNWVVVVTCFGMIVFRLIVKWASLVLVLFARWLASSLFGRPYSFVVITG